MNQLPYYYNTESGETSWTIPEDDSAEGGDYAFMEYAVLRLQAMWRARAARIRMAKLLAQIIEEVKDPITGQIFYHNRRTGQSLW